MFEDPLFWVLVLPGLLLGLFAQSRIKLNVTKYSQVETRDGITGAEVARRLLDAQGLHPEPPPWLSAGRNLEHHLLAVERAHPEPSTEHRLRQVDRDLAEDVEAFAAEKAIRLYLEGHDEIAGGLTGPAGQTLAR